MIQQMVVECRSGLAYENILVPPPSIERKVVTLEPAYNDKFNFLLSQEAKCTWELAPLVKIKLLHCVTKIYIR